MRASPIHVLTPGSPFLDVEPTFLISLHAFALSCANYSQMRGCKWKKRLYLSGTKASETHHGHHGFVFSSGDFHFLAILHWGIRI